MKRSTQRFLSLINRLDELYEMKVDYFVQKRSFLIPNEEHYEVTPEMEKELDTQIKVTWEQIRL